jgi:GNAT superfamily N-acetyltransferase
MAPTVQVCPATRDDIPALWTLIDALADYEKLPRPTADARDRLVRDGFGPKPRFETHLARIGGKTVGYAILFETYSTFLAKPTLYLEDIFVAPESRGRGAGKALFEFCIAEAQRRGCGRMEWAVLDWNQPALDFYSRYSARHMKEWRLYRLTEDRFAPTTGLAHGKR